MTLADYHRKLGATLAPDFIPYHYGDLNTEFKTALQQAVLMDRSHEGRLSITGNTRFELFNRMSTNKMNDLAVGEGRATIFTSSTARIIERVETYHRGDDLLVLTPPSRRENFQTYLQRHIFFNDDVKIADITDKTHQFALHGVESDNIIAQIHPSIVTQPLFHVIETKIHDMPVTIARRKAIVGSHWMIVTTRENGARVYQSLLELGQPNGLKPSGSLTYNTLRIMAGMPAINELNEDYLPLELGLWDEVSFHKGCYTGQEIIARMDSREKLARVMVAIHLPTFVQSPAPIRHHENLVGTLTSSVVAPSGEIFAIGIVKMSTSQLGTLISVGENGVQAHIGALLGVQPQWVAHS